MILDKIIEKYDLKAKSVDTWVYLKKQKNMNGLKQSDILSNKLLQKWLPPSGYRQLFEPNYDDNDASPYHRVWQPLSVAGQEEDTAPGFVVEKDATKNWGYIDPCVQVTIGFITVVELSE